MTLRGLSKASIVIAVFISIVALIALIAWLGDLAAVPRLRIFGQESVEYFLSFKQEGFSKPAYFADMKPGNAWDYYAPMIALVESVETDRRLLTDFLNGADPDSGRAAALVIEADSVLKLLKEGARRQTAVAPLDYENGLNVVLPNYMALMSASQLLACRARLRLRSDPEGAVDDVMSGLVFAGDVAGGDLTLIGYMVGAVCLATCRKQIEEALTELDAGELENLARDILMLADEWPLHSRNLEAEHRMASISLSRIGLDEYGMMGLPTFKRFPKEFLGWWVYHLLSWRQGFSFRRTQLGAISSGMRMVSDLALAERNGWEAEREKAEEWGSRSSRTANWLVRLSAPNFAGMHRRRYEAVAGAKLAGAGALLQIYHRQNGHWPDALRQAELDGLEDLFIDPITGEEFRYLVHPGGDSVCVYSVGTDLEDDGGVREIETADLVLVLHPPSQPR